jgi:dinuclear metal center YbgI/SA1388 family protein
LKIHDIIRFLDTIAPREWQESYDNAGLIVGNESWDCQGVLICLDSTEQIVEEAIDKKCNLIIAHHPILFSGIKKINGNHYVEKALIKAIKNDIAIFAIHTNLDNAYRNGVNMRIAEQISLVDTTVLLPKTYDKNVDMSIGAGLTGYLTRPMQTHDFLHFLKERMELSILKHTKIIKNSIHKVALCGGAGSFLIHRAIASDSDIYITSDIKYHEFFEANNQIILADIGHYESEKYTIDLLFNILQNNFSTFAIHFTKHITNPVNYL